MRHKHKGRKLGTSHGHTKAMKVSLTQALFLNDRIKTTETRAKEIRGNVDRIITWAKRGDLHARRLAIAALGNDSELVREIFEKVSQGMFEGRPGGYTRIMKLGPRKGDGARMVIMELVTENCVPKAERKAAKASGAKAKTTPKKKAAPTKKEEKAAEDEVKAEEKANDADRENVIERIHDSIEAAEEEGAEQIREEGEEQLAEEKAEAAKEDAEAAKAAGEPVKEDLKEAAEEALEKKEAKAAGKESAKDEAEAAEDAEEVREEEFKAEEDSAKDAEAEDNAPNPADMPESEEHAE